MSNEINFKQKILKKAKIIKTDKSRADKKCSSQENDRLIHARTRRIRKETKTNKKTCLKV